MSLSATSAGVSGRIDAPPAASLQVKLGRLELPNPIMVASGSDGSLHSRCTQGLVCAEQDNIK